MSKIIRVLATSVTLILLCLAMVSCFSEEDPPHVHLWGEWQIELEPTLDSEGSKFRICTGCQEKETELISKLIAEYYITIVIDDKEEKIPVLSDGLYTLAAAPEKTGYSFKGYFKEDGTEFPISSVINSSVKVVAVYELLPTTTFAELKSRIEAGVDILLGGDIILEDTIYVTDNIKIFTSGHYTLKRSQQFFGDLFVLGMDADGHNTILQGKAAKLDIKPSAGASITIDGDKGNIVGDVVGTAFFLKNSAELNIYDGVNIVNLKKTGNDLLLKDGHNISDPHLAGGAAVIIANGSFNMYGGKISGCEVDMDDSASTDSELQTEGYNNSSRGGAIFNYGTFNMFGGIIEDCQAGRGGAIYNYRIMYLYAGSVKDNYTSSYGGAFYNPNSQYIYAVIGQNGTDIKMVIEGNCAGKTGGAIFTSHQSTVYVVGSTAFKGNKALGGNGGAINTAGAVVIDYAEFVQNTASSKGGAIYAYYNSPENAIRIVQIKSGTFFENEAPRGGAIAFGAGDSVSLGAVGEIGNVTFDKNKAPVSSKYGYGAAMHIDSASAVRINGSARFTNNLADDNGGAIYITKQSTLEIKAEVGAVVLFDSNVTSGGNAGAIYNSGSTVNLIATGGSVKFVNNSANGGNGGALAVHSDGITKLYGVLAESNKAAEYGGFLYVYGAKAVIGDTANKTATVIKSCEAEKGGAIYVSSTSKASASLHAYEITAEKNSSTDGGGAIYVVANEDYFTDVKITSLIVRENECNKNGGAIYIYTAANVWIGNLNATLNKTASGKYGGVAYISGAATVTIDNIEASQNSAGSGGCIYLTTSGTTLTINAGDITGNEAEESGNAIWVNSKKSVLKLKIDESDAVILKYTSGEIHGVDGFAITEYKESVE